jgi:hypothetical protein
MGSLAPRSEQHEGASKMGLGNEAGSGGDPAIYGGMGRRRWGRKRIPVPCDGVRGGQPQESPMRTRTD